MQTPEQLSDIAIFDRLLSLGENATDQGAVTACIVRRGKIIHEAPSIDVGVVIHAEHRAFGFLDQQNDHIEPDDILYTTLEPCSVREDSHRGIADCTSIILKSGIQHVVFAASDPMQSKVTRKRFSDAGVELRQIDDPQIIDRARRLFNSRVSGYQI